MTPEQIKKHEPMNINNLYEAVPVENELPPEGGRYPVILSDRTFESRFYFASTNEFNTVTPVTHWLRPVTRESIEAFLREFGEAYGKSVLQSISDTFLKPDNLAKASFNDQPAIQAMGETIVNFPLPDITELIKQYTEQ